ncbi:MAG: hypothetical protein V1736_07825 [Pseudomonadota bacterium]
MDLITKTDIEELMKHSSWPCISIFMPAHRAGKEIQQDRIRLKDLLREAEQNLVQKGLRRPEAKELLKEPTLMVEDHSFWEQQSDGLAIFLSPERYRVFRLPLDFKEFVLIADRFYVKPILPLFMGDGRFYILALSQGQTRLLQGTHYSVHQIALETLPKSLQETLWYDDPQRQLQFHTGTSTPGGPRRGAMFHGHGVGIDDNKTNMLRYFHKVNDGLHELLRDERWPLVLAGVDYLFPLYKEANTYNYFMEEHISGNPELLSPEDLHRGAWAIVAPYFDRERGKAAARYREVFGTKYASNNLESILLAACMGRVDYVFSLRGIEQWGTYRAETMETSLHPNQEPGDIDLIYLAIICTVLNRGTAYVLGPERMPQPAESAVAALFRY